MKITLRYWSRQKNSFNSDFNYRFERTFEEKTAKSCMAQVEEFRYNHDVSKYTPTEIVNVED